MHVSFHVRLISLKFLVIFFYLGPMDSLLPGGVGDARGWGQDLLEYPASILIILMRKSCLGWINLSTGDEVIQDGLSCSTQD